MAEWGFGGAMGEAIKRRLGKKEPEQKPPAGTPSASASPKPKEKEKPKQY